MSVSEAVVALLRNICRFENFNNDIEFKVFTSKDFSSNTIANGVSLFVYRIYCNGAHRIPAGRIGPDGKRLQAQLPVEMHFLLTVWGKDPSLQHTLIGWLMRALEDNPTIPAALLNAVTPGVFRADESVDICLTELRTEDLLRIWDVLGVNVYQLSVPYVARIINIESLQPVSTSGEVVQERVLEAARYEQDN